MNRLFDYLQKRSNNRFHFLIGPGISDLFATNPGQFEPFLDSINPILHDLGFDRIIHVSPTHVVSCLDEELHQTPRRFLWPERDAILNTGVVNGISMGPFGIPGQNVIHNNQRAGKQGLGDVHGIRLLDLLMRETQYHRTACVIFDAMTYVNHFDAPRILLGILNEWLLFPQENQNECFFVIPVESHETLGRQLGGHSLSQLLNRNNLEQNLSNVIQIGYPNSYELASAITYEREITHKQADPINEIVRICLTEEEPLRTWLTRFQLLDKITILEIRQHGWFKSSNGDPRSVEEKLNGFIGMNDVKKFIRLIQGYAAYLSQKSEEEKNQNFHSIFYGNPGTGKTSIARLFGQIFQETGLLNKGHLIEVKGSDLIAEFVGGTGVKTNEVINRAMDGVLFIDEAYSLSGEERGGFGKEAIEVIIKRMEDDRNRLVIILAGYKEEMLHFLNTNPGLDRRFPKVNRLEFPDFTAQELFEILLKELSSRNLTWNDPMFVLLEKVISNLHKNKRKHFGNAGEIRNLAESIEMRVKARMVNTDTNLSVISEDDIPVEYYSIIQSNDLILDEILAPLDEFVGMDPIRKHIIAISKVMKLDLINKSNQDMQRKKYLEHYLFLGNPGTGKTTTAKVMGDILFNLGILRTRNVIEVSAVDLIAGYVGQTPEKARRIIEKAIDGILFIDEAYTLLPAGISGVNGYGREVIDTLVKSMEELKDRLVVILAGYSDEMIELVHSNPGLNSRFTKIISFPDFTPDQLGEILIRLCKRDGYVISDEVLEQAVNLLFK